MAGQAEMNRKAEEIPRATREPTRGGPLLPWRVLCLLTFVLLALVLYRLFLVLPHHTGVNHVAGAWATLADDLRHGSLYRPLMSELGYGGTRYMPLHFVLHAGLMRLTGEPLWSGYILTLLSLLATCGAIWVWLRRLGAERWLATVAAALVLAAAPIQLALITIRGDLLAAALSLWGLALCPCAPEESAAESGEGNARVVWPALFFTLAFLTKITAVFGAAAAIGALWLSPGRRRAAWRLLLYTAIGFAVGLALTTWASHGRIWESMRACASGGHPSLRGIQHLIFRAFENDPVGVFLIAVALAAAASLPRSQWRRLPTLAFAFSGLVTLFISLSPGADWNHLIDVDLCALVVLVSVAIRGPVPSAWGTSLLSALALLAVVHTAAIGTVSNARSNQMARRESVAAIREMAASGVVLVENVGMAIEAGQRPYLLDPFSLRLLRQRRPDIDRDFLGKMDSRFFRAIVLPRDPSKETERGWYENWHLGPGFLERLAQNYRRDERYALSHVYVPK